MKYQVRAACRGDWMIHRTGLRDWKSKCLHCAHEDPDFIRLDGEKKCARKKSEEKTQNNRTVHLLQPRLYSAKEYFANTCKLHGHHTFPLAEIQPEVLAPAIFLRT